MRQESAIAIRDAAESEAIGVEGDFRIRSDYSGRGMYGKTTYAIVTNNMGNFVAAVASAAVEMVPELQAGFVEDMQNLRLDNMGLGMIAY